MNKEEDTFTSRLNWSHVKVGSNHLGQKVKIGSNHLGQKVKKPRVN